jgi:hypothetical protein
MDGSPTTDSVIDDSGEVTLESLASRIDIIGQQLDWLIDNLAGLFSFVNQMSTNGGGVMGLMKMLKTAPSQMPQMQPEMVSEDVQ